MSLSEDMFCSKVRRTGEVVVDKEVRHVSAFVDFG